MFAMRSELLEKIRLGEDNFLEFKEVRFAGGKIRGPGQDDLADELAAFANSRGGVLLLGVHDKTREVVGIPVDRLDAAEALIRQACEDSMKPPGVPVIERINLPDSAGVERPVIRVEVPPRSGCPSEPRRILSPRSGPRSGRFHPTTWQDCSSSVARRG